MAFKIKKSDHLYIPFNRFGFPLVNKRGDTRVYKNLKTLRRYIAPYGTNGSETPTTKAPANELSTYADIVEFAPVVHARWKHRTCTACRNTYSGKDNPKIGFSFCPFCGAKMDQRD